ATYAGRDLVPLRPPTARLATKARPQRARPGRLPPLWGAPPGVNRVIVAVVFGRSGLLTRAPFLFVAVAFVIAFGAALPLVQTSLSAPTLPAVAAGGLALAA